MITLEKLRSCPRYRKLSSEELMIVLEMNIRYVDYQLLQGDTTEEKAQNLINSWNRGNVNIGNIPYQFA